MEGMYGYSEDKPLLSPENLIIPSEYHSLIINHSSTPPPLFGGGGGGGGGGSGGADDLISEAASITHHGIQRADHDHDHDNQHGACSTDIKSRIASHHLYPRLLQSYIDCHKVGASPEVARVLEEIGRESQLVSTSQQARQLGEVDAELDEFMETYCEILEKYRLDLSRPFDEATSFLNDIESQLRNLCKDVFVNTAHTTSDEGVASSDEEYSGGEIDVHDLQPKDEERDLKDQLLRRFGSHISSLKLEFSKKKKKGKLPREARHTLFEWWNAHYKWPYPTEADKIALAEATGLDQRQINNWFINQRKRHWKPSENMHYALMDNVSGQYFTDD